MKTTITTLLILLLAIPSLAWDFVVLSDTHLLEAETASGPYGTMYSTITIQRNLITDIRSRTPDMVFVTGDLTFGDTIYTAYGTQLDDWITEFAPIHTTDGIPIYPIRGNHDYLADTSGSVWQTKMNAAYSLPQNGPSGELSMTYSVTNSDAVFLCVDEYANGSETTNQNWVNSTIQANPNKLVFVFGHENLFEYNTNTYMTFADNPGPRNVLWELTQWRKGSIYFCGHIHAYNLSEIGGSYQCAVGGASFINLGTHGYAGTLNNPYTITELQASYSDPGGYGSIGYTYVDVTTDSDHYDVTITYYHYNSGTGACSAGTPYTYAVPFSSLSTPSTMTGGYSITNFDTTPDPFTFTDVLDASPSTLYTSSTKTLSGTDHDAALSITGGEYQINGGSWTSTSGKIAPESTFAVRIYSSSDHTITNSTLTIGGVSDTFSVIPNQFYSDSSCSASSTYSALRVPANAVTNAGDGFWESSNGTSHWWQYDLGSGYSRALTKFIFYTFIGYSGAYSLRGSNASDFSTYTELASGTDEGGHDLEINISNSTVYRYIRMYFTNTSYAVIDNARAY